jgi:hypothetical protein
MKENHTPVEEEKLKERALLLMRYFWWDRLFEIGKQLRLPYFDKFLNYWEIEHGQAALEIAKNITDNELLDLIGKYPPKYGLELGGFQGNYYTADEKGNVAIKSSWEEVRKNVQAVLEKWGEKAYGLLQALVNKGGRASYFDLIHEIEKVLGYEFVPSYLLPRLQPFKLVFKTGSNKYPDWTMPPEIIVVVKDELSKFKRPPTRKTIVRLTYTKVQQMIDDKVGEIIEKRRYINQLFKSKFGINLFKDNEKVIWDIRRPCSNEEEFNNRILALALLIDQIEVEELKKKIRGIYEAGSINILEAFLKENFPNYNIKIIRNFREIITLRSKKYPVHRDDVKFINSMKYFGVTTFPPDWEVLWESVLEHYLESLNLLMKTLSGE